MDKDIFDDLERKIKVLIENFKEKSNSLKHSQQKYNELKKNFDSFAFNHEQNEKDIEMLRQENNIYKAEINSLKSRLDSYEKTAKRVMTELDIVYNEIEDFQA